LFLFVATTSLMMSTACPPFMMKSPYANPSGLAFLFLLLGSSALRRSTCFFESFAVQIHCRLRWRPIAPVVVRQIREMLSKYAGEVWLVPATLHFLDKLLVSFGEIAQSVIE